MRAKQRRGTAWAARLGLVALALNALVPIHVAFDLAGALAPAHQHRHARTEHASTERRLLALLVGHPESGRQSDEHGKGHGTACPVCSALGALAGFAVPAPTVLSVPVLAELSPALPTARTEPLSAPAAYRSRVPPPA